MPRTTFTDPAPVALPCTLREALVMAKLAHIASEVYAKTGKVYGSRWIQKNAEVWTRGLRSPNRHRLLHLLQEGCVVPGCLYLGGDEHLIPQVTGWGIKDLTNAIPLCSKRGTNHHNQSKGSRDFLTWVTMKGWSLDAFSPDVLPVYLSAKWRWAEETGHLDDAPEPALAHLAVTLIERLPLSYRQQIQRLAGTRQLMAA